MNLQSRSGLSNKPNTAPSPSGREFMAPVDVSSLVELYGEEQVELLLTAFVEHSDRMFAELEKEIGSHNKESILSNLHQMKAMAGGVFANELARSVRELEQKCKQNDVVWSDVEYDLSECISLYELMRSYVSGVLEIQLS
jgi:Hpt domain.